MPETGTPLLLVISKGNACIPHGKCQTHISTSYQQYLYTLFIILSSRSSRVGIQVCTSRHYQYPKAGFSGSVGRVGGPPMAPACRMYCNPECFICWASHSRPFR